MRVTAGRRPPASATNPASAALWQIRSARAAIRVLHHPGKPRGRGDEVEHRVGDAGRPDRQAHPIGGRQEVLLGRCQGRRFRQTGIVQADAFTIGRIGEQGSRCRTGQGDNAVGRQSSRRQRSPIRLASRIVADPANHGRCGDASGDQRRCHIGRPTARTRPGAGWATHARGSAGPHRPGERHHVIEARVAGDGHAGHPSMSSASASGTTWPM